MAPTIDYHCACASDVTVPPPPTFASSSASFHPLHELFFCEECDAVRCNRCVSVEVSGYYCPNCLFEVPSASVRAEKNRCALKVYEPVGDLTNFKALVVRATASCAHAVEIRSPWSLRILRKPKMADPCPSALWASHHSSYTATIAVGTRLKLGSHSRSPRVLQVCKLPLSFQFT